MNYFKRNKNSIAIIFGLFVLSLFACISFIHSGFPKTDDGSWMIIRFSAFYSAFKEGEIPVRWLGRLNNGYGYPVADFLYPGFMYLGIPLAVMLSSFVTTVKTLFVLSLSLSGIGMFLFLRKKYDAWSAFVGALVYLYSPYHLYDATVRGSLGEVLALSIIPSIFWLVERDSLLWAGIAIALLILSHNTLALLFLPVVVLYVFLSKSVNKKNAVISIIGGVGIATFFWLPAVLDLRYTVFSKVIVSDWSHYFASLQVIGIIQLLIIFVIVVIFFLKAEKRKKIFTASTILFLVCGIISLFLSSSLSQFAWPILPVKFIQFPFRFLSLGIFACAALVPLIMSVVTLKKVVGLIIIVLSIVTSYPYLVSHAYDFYPDSYYSTNVDTTTVKNEYMPRSVNQVPTSLPTAKVIAEQGTIDNLVTTNKKYSFMVTTSQQTRVTINQLYFPGWKAYLDAREIPINYSDPRGIMQVAIPKGQHSVRVLFQETSYRLISDIISIVSLISLAIISFLVYRKRYEK